MKHILFMGLVLSAILLVVGSCMTIHPDVMNIFRWVMKGLAVTFGMCALGLIWSIKYGKKS